MVTYNHFNSGQYKMSRRKKSKDNNPMPATGAGLIRFYSESDSPGIKFGPTPVFVAAALLILFILFAHYFL